MRQTSRSGRIFSLAVALLLAGAAVRADTIVLKNGRRIFALSVREAGDKVVYETSAGELSLPKSIVDHIEKGREVPMADSPAAAGRIWSLPCLRCKRQARARKLKTPRFMAARLTGTTSRNSKERRGQAENARI